MAIQKRASIELSDADRARLERIRDHPSTRQKHAWRANIVLHLGAGHGLIGDRCAGRGCRSRRSGAGGTGSARRGSTGSCAMPRVRRERSRSPGSGRRRWWSLAMSPPPSAGFALDAAGAGGADGRHGEFSTVRKASCKSARPQAAPGQDLQGLARSRGSRSRSGTWWASASTRPTTPWCSRWTKRRRFRLSGGRRGPCR